MRGLRHGEAILRPLLACAVHELSCGRGRGAPAPAPGAGAKGPGAPNGGAVPRGRVSVTLRRRSIRRHARRIRGRLPGAGA